MCYPLSIRNNDIVDGLMEGLNRKEIAARLNISPGTVKMHIATIARKMHINTKRFNARIRIVYLTAMHRRMIERPMMQSEANTNRL